ncbi:MAG: methylated-DNA--[protein]-cysteine S-methyltransferase [Gemmatimonadota bacterium]
MSGIAGDASTGASTEASTKFQDALDYRRVERAIRFLDRHRESQPELGAVADHVGLSKYHFHRLFSRWVGTTPKRFLQHLTVERARGLLRDSESVLDAAFRSGLSGGSRLHDHFVTVESVTPGQVRSRGAGLTIHTGVHPSPFGEAFVAATDRGICFLAFLPAEGDRGRGEAERSVRQELTDLWPEAALVGAPEATGAFARRAFDVDVEDREGGADAPISLHLRGTNFQIQVWRALLRIPPGHVTSYGRLAQLLKRAGSARAVGGAVARNPVAYLIPCHRVIRESGEVGGYRWGEERKRLMLGREVEPTP